MEQAKVKIDHELLMQTLKEQGKTSRELSVQMRYKEGYIATVHKRGDEYPAAVEVLMCTLLSKEPGYFILKEEPPKQSVGDLKILENIFQQCKLINQSLQQLTEEQETIFRKVNANTVQLEKIKESLACIAKSDLDKAVDFLKNILSEGRVEGSKIILEAESAGIKRGDLMRAKKELGVQVETGSYGKNQKSWWYLKF